MLAAQRLTEEGKSRTSFAHDVNADAALPRPVELQE